MSRPTAAQRQDRDAALVRASQSTGQIAMVIDLLDGAITLEASRYGAETEIGAKLRQASRTLNEAHNLSCARGRAI